MIFLTKDFMSAWRNVKTQANVERARSCDAPAGGLMRLLGNQGYSKLTENRIEAEAASLIPLLEGSNPSALIPFRSWRKSSVTGSYRDAVVTCCRPVHFPVPALTSAVILT